MGYIFNGTNKIITLTTGTTTVSVRDIYSRFVDWYLTDDNSKYLPAFKTGINQYQMSCRNKTYRITDTELRNAAGAVVYQQAFGAQVPLQRITAGSPAQKQFDSVCT